MNPYAIRTITLGVSGQKPTIWSYHKLLASFFSGNIPWNSSLKHRTPLLLSLFPSLGTWNDDHGCELLCVFLCWGTMVPSCSILLALYGRCVKWTDYSDYTQISADGFFSTRIEGPRRRPSGKWPTVNYGNSPFLLGNVTINDHFQ